MKNEINIGSIIEEKFKERGITKSEFARRINCSRGTVYNIFNSTSVDIARLKKISMVLDYDFLELYK